VSFFPSLVSPQGDGLQRATLSSFKRRLNEKAWCVREFERKEQTYDATEGRQ